MYSWKLDFEIVKKNAINSGTNGCRYDLGRNCGYPKSKSQDTDYD